jgi:hypothetical protein
MSLRLKSQNRPSANVYSPTTYCLTSLARVSKLSVGVYVNIPFLSTSVNQVSTFRLSFQLHIQQLIIKYTPNNILPVWWVFWKWNCIGFSHWILDRRISHCRSWLASKWLHYEIHKQLQSVSAASEVITYCHKELKCRVHGDIIKKLHVAFALDNWSFPRLHGNGAFPSLTPRSTPLASHPLFDLLRWPASLIRKFDCGWCPRI